eukprot:TRINITY_DN2580_c0_g2_i15.p1 TRINITY_DN2580_c0_g2~~TRINITY_DN2580_c0_g2_i15.p1  ORF type:complete len:109 (-),score=21.62 TRINITY_DN2580_c0_g2_i15:204-530(-)
MAKAICLLGGSQGVSGQVTFEEIGEKTRIRAKQWYQRRVRGARKAWMARTTLFVRILTSTAPLLKNNKKPEVLFSLCFVLITSDRARSVPSCPKEDLHKDVCTNFNFL